MIPDTSEKSSTSFMHKCTDVGAIDILENYLQTNGVCTYKYHSNGVLCLLLTNVLLEAQSTLILCK